MKLHLGCGKRFLGDDWIHIDCEKHPHVLQHDVTELHFEDNSCDLIYASHLLEYFDRQEAAILLLEWCRVLAPGGILRLAVPDFETMSRLYQEGMSLDRFLGPLYGRMGSDPVIYHKTVYDYESLRLVLLAAGFSGVLRYDWRTTTHADVDDFSQAYLPHMDKENGILISLNVEATK